MVKAYSLDLRKLVLSHLEGGSDKKSVSQLFNIGIATVYRWARQKREKGHLQIQENQSRYRKLDYEQLQLYVENNPDLFLFEIADHFGVAQQTIFYALKKLKITRKKRLRFIRNEMKRKERLLSKH